MLGPGFVACFTCILPFLLLIPGAILHGWWRAVMRVTGAAESPQPVSPEPDVPENLRSMGQAGAPATSPGHTAARPRELQSSARRHAAAKLTLGIGILLMVITFLPRGEGEPFYLGGLVFGLGFIYLGLYLDIGARGPNIVLRLPRSSLVLGEPMRIAYHLTGKVDRVRQLKMAFRAREESTYDEKNHERTVWSITILDSSDPSLIRRGEVTVTLPLEAMPTLVIGDSKIAWTLEVSGPVEGAPDILDVFAVTVEAAPCKSSS